MTETLEIMTDTDYDGTGTDVSQIFHEDDLIFVGPPAPTYFGRTPDRKFADIYEA